MMSIRTFIAAALTAFALNAAAAVDANTASRADLETIRGVGPGLSAKIIEARKSTPFKDWNDMVERVGGIGDGNAARLSQAGMTVGGASYTAASGKAAADSGKTGNAADSRKGEKAQKTDKAETKVDKKADTATKTAEKRSDKKPETTAKP